MATKRYGQENFFIEMPDGKTLAFYCWTTDTRNGFCHTVWCCDRDETTKCSYWNRMWECYTYQSVLRKAFEKLPKEYREACKLWDIAKEHGESEKCEAFVKQFEKVYKQTPAEVKEKLANSDIHLETEEQARGLMGLMHLATVMSKGA